MKKLSVVLMMMALFVSVSACTLFGSRVTIGENERGVVANEKRDIQVLEPGTHVLSPFSEEPSIYPLTEQTYTMSGAGDMSRGNDAVEARSKDAHQLWIDATVTFRYLPDHLVEIRQIWQTPDRFISGFIRPMTRNVVYNTAGQFNYKEVISSKRSEVEAIMTQKLAEEFPKQGVELVKFSLLDVRGE